MPESKSDLKLGRSQSGSILLIVMVLCAMLGWMLLQWTDFQSIMGRNRNHQKIKFAAEAIHQSVLEHIYNDDSWTATAGSNSCLSSGLLCPPNAGGPLILKSSDNSIFVDSSQPKSGFTISGVLCNPAVDGGFSLSGNAACPFHYDLKWTSINCASGKCEIQISGTLLFEPGSKELSSIAFNLSKYSVDLIRERESESLRSACTSLGGTFNQVTLACSAAPVRGAVCPNGQMIRKVVEGQAPTCEVAVITVNPCPVGTAARGIKADGSLDCQPGP